MFSGACERAKRQLSTAHIAEIRLEYLFSSAGVVVGSQSTILTTPVIIGITRTQFETLNADFFARVLEPIVRVLSDAELDKADIDEVSLVGGTSRIPRIQSVIREYFDGAKPLDLSLNADEAMAFGATLQVG